MTAKRIFDEFLSGEEWLIEQHGWRRPLQQIKEAQFTLGNGIIGSRGIMEELPYDANAGTFISGIYDRFGAQISELVNLPNPIVFRADVGGEKLDPSAMDVLEHYRALDIKKGLLVRHTIYESAHKKKIDYQSYRFISQYQKYIGAMVVTIMPRDATMTFNINSMIDTSICNRGVLTEGRKRHFEVVDVSGGRGKNYTEIETFEHQHRVGYATCMEIIQNGRRRSAPDRIFKIKIKKGEKATFIKYFTIVPSFYERSKSIKKIAMKELARGRKLGVKRLFQANENKWERLWNTADIIMEGSEIRQKAIRFNLYHLLIAGNADDRVSIGARTLSGEGYRGHVFWDAETFILPFFLFTNPEIAKSMLMYRFNRLGHARKIAAAKGYSGALFPWESADTGEEVTPTWLKDLTGEILKIETHEEEQHIVADIAYAINQYVRATDDTKFMMNMGLEMLIETARFWQSRVKFNKKRKRYEMNRIMGPDEFHSDTNNNAYSNEMARFNLEIASYWYGWAKEKYPKKLKILSVKLRFTERELNKFKNTASNIYIPYSKKKKVIEQFDGYLKLKDVKITQLDRYFMPVLPPEAHPAEDGKTQLIKQADVVMLLFMLREGFSSAEARRNFDFYEPKTLHKSSLSPSVHSIIAARIREVDKALHYLTVALESDLLDIHGNAAEGFHAAAGGGVWQAMIFGFGGMDFKNGNIAFNPLLPKMWKSFSFKIFWHGALLEIKICSKSVKIKRLSTGRKKELIVEVGGVKKDVPLKKTAIFNMKLCNENFCEA